MRILKTVVFLLMCVGFLHAQDGEVVLARMISASVDIDFPIAGFKEELDDLTLLGYSFSYFKQVDTSHYSFIGAEVSYTHIGSFSNTINNAGFDSFNDLTSSDFFSLLISYRHFTPFYYKTIEPFIQGGLGPQFFVTTTNTTFLNDNESSDFRFEERSTGLAYEIGLGLMANIYSGFNLFTSFNFRGGSSVSYLRPDPNGLVSEFPIDSFVLRRDVPSYLKWQIGISYSY